MISNTNDYFITLITLITFSTIVAARENNHNELELTHLPQREPPPPSFPTSSIKDNQFNYLLTDANLTTNTSTYYVTSTRPATASLKNYKLPRLNYCTLRPQNMSFCSKDLDWGDNMRLPNLLGHTSPNELNRMLMTMPLIEALSNVNCDQIQQMKLLLCSMMSPICVNMAILPCRSMCFKAKNSCEPSLKNLGLEWPRFLDCKEFPSKARENCIGDQLMFATIAPDVTSTILRDDTRNTTTTTSSKTTTKRRRKERKNKINGRLTTTMSSTITTTMAPTATLTDSAPNNAEQTQDNSLISLGEMTTTPTTSVISEEARDTADSTTAYATVFSSTTAATSTSLITSTIRTTSSTTPQPVRPSPTIEETSNSTQESNEDDSPSRQDYSLSSSASSSSMPVNVTDDLTQLLCSTPIEWLIKTKLSDVQLMNAVRRRKLKVRSYLQVFGLLTTNKDGASSSLARSSQRIKTNSSNLYLSISNTTLFVTAMGSHLYTQPISEALPRAADSSGANLSSSLKTVRYYLIAGSGPIQNIIPTNVFVVWPTGKFTNDDLSSQGSANIIRTYREFKRKKLKVCNLNGPTDADVNLNRSDQLSSPNRGSHGRRSNRSRQDRGVSALNNEKEKSIPSVKFE